MTRFCERCRREHPGRECDYDPETGICAETKEPEWAKEVNETTTDVNGVEWTNLGKEISR